MAALMPGVESFHAEGDLFMLDRSALAAVDRLEDYDERRAIPGLYVRTRVEIALLTGGHVRVATAYRVRDPVPWRALVADGKAELLARYPRRLADATLSSAVFGARATLVRTT